MGCPLLPTNAPIYKVTYVERWVSEAQFLTAIFITPVLPPSSNQNKQETQTKSRCQGTRSQDKALMLTPSRTLGMPQSLSALTQAEMTATKLLLGVGPFTPGPKTTTKSSCSPFIEELCPVHSSPSRTQPPGKTQYREKGERGLA